MKKSAIYLVVIFSVLLMALATISYVYLVRTNPFRNPVKPDVKTKLAEEIQVDPNLRILDPLGRQVPFDIYFDEVEGIVVSGIVQEEKIKENGTLLINVAKNPKEPVLVWTYLGSADRPTLLLKLSDSQFGSTEEWTGTNNLSELSSLLLPGKQVIVHIEESDKAKVDELIQKGNKEFFVEIAPMARIIVGI